MDQFKNHPLYRRHNLDSAMSSLWDFYKSRFLVLFLISIVMSLAISYASTFVNMKELQAVTDPEIMLAKIREMILPIIGVSLINLLFATILQHYLLHNPVDGSISIFVSSYKSLRYFVPYLIILVLFSVFASAAILLGIFVLVIGAFFAIIYVLTLYMFILPILMVEGTYIGNAISRTFSLAHRNFWSNIGWVAVFILLLIVISVVLSGIILLPFSGSFFRTLLHPEEASKMLDMATNPLFIGLSALANAITFPLMPVFGLILYFNGRAAEEQKDEIYRQAAEESGPKVEDLYARPVQDESEKDPSEPK